LPPQPSIEVGGIFEARQRLTQGKPQLSALHAQVRKNETHQCAFYLGFRIFENLRGFGQQNSQRCNGFLELLIAFLMLGFWNI
jgi:hypothetical protein